MSAFSGVATLGVQPIWDGVVARTVHGDRLTLAVVELDAGSSIPSHSHDNEQLGLVIEGTIRFTVGDETRELGPGATWCIPSQVSHGVVAGLEGAVVVEVFAPARDDWRSLETRPAGRGRWPA